MQHLAGVGGLAAAETPHQLQHLREEAVGLRRVAVDGEGHRQRLQGDGPPLGQHGLRVVFGAGHGLPPRLHGHFGQASVAGDIRLDHQAAHGHVGEARLPGDGSQLGVDQAQSGLVGAVGGDEAGPGAGGVGAHGGVGDASRGVVGAFEDPPRVGVLLARAVGVADARQQLHLRRLVVGEALVHQLLGPGQDVVDRHRLPARHRSRQQESVEGVDLLRPRELGHGQVALARRGPRLPHGPGQAGHQRDQHDGGQGQGQPVAPRELRRPVAQAVGPGADGLVVQEAPQVVGQGGGRGVALAGVLLEGLGRDGVEVAAQRAPQPLGRGAQACGPLLGRVLALPRARGHGHPRRVLPEHGLDQRRRRAQRRAGRMAPGQELVEQHAHGVDIRGRGDGPARHLLRSGVFGREGADALARHQRGRRRRIFILQELGNAEVQQLHAAVGGHQHVRGLDVAVDDQVGVRVREGVEHVEQQPQPGLHAQAARVAVAVDVCAFHVFEDEVGLAGRGDAGVHQVRDVRMPQPPQDGALAAEALLAHPADHRRVQQLDRHLSLEAPVAAAGPPDGAHPALAQRRHQRVGADDLPGQRRRRRRPGLEEAGPEQGAVLRDELLQLGGQPGVLRAHGLQQGPQLGALRVEGLVEVGAECQPAVLVEARHVLWGHREGRSKHDTPGAGPLRPALRTGARGAGTGGPSPSAAARCARTRCAWPRSPGRRSRRRTSG